MDRVLGSFRFLLATAVCCGLTVACTSWATESSPGDLRALASLIGFGAALAVMLLIAWVIATEEGMSSAPIAVRLPEQQQAIEPEDEAIARTELRRLLDEGRALHATREAVDTSVTAWVANVRRALESHKPGLLGYFDALGGRAYPTDAEKLDAHVRRLATIVRDFS